MIVWIYDDDGKDKLHSDNFHILNTMNNLLFPLTMPCRYEFVARKFNDVDATLQSFRLNIEHCRFS